MNDDVSRAASPFRPGFRLSWLDVAVLIGGAVGVGWAQRFSGEAAALGAVVALHFFLFCNVFRLARGPELVWSACFVGCLAVRVGFDAPWTVLGPCIGAVTVGLIWRETRKASYHGALWRRFNPDLPSWWQGSERGGRA